MKMESDSTLIAVASIPMRIWAVDSGTWKAWLTSRYADKKTTSTTKQRCKKAVADFYYLLELPISEVTEEHISDYQAYLRGRYCEGSVRSLIAPIRSYWRFAHTQVKEALV